MCVVWWSFNLASFGGPLDQAVPGFSAPPAKVPAVGSIKQNGRTSNKLNPICSLRLDPSNKTAKHQTEFDLQLAARFIEQNGKTWNKLNSICSLVANRHQIFDQNMHAILFQENTRYNLQSGRKASITVFLADSPHNKQFSPDGQIFGSLQNKHSSPEAQSSLNNIQFSP